MRRFHFKQPTLLYLALIALISVSISGIYFWKVKNWNEITRGLMSKEKRTFSILELMGSSDVYEVVKPNVPTILMEPQNPFVEPRSLTNINERRPLAVVLVTSMAKYFNQRHVIRVTWYKWAKQLNIRVFFMIGFHNGGDQLLQLLGEEQRRHNDLIIDDFEEGYYKLPGKVLRMLKWYNSTYTDETGPRFFIKTDQDVFLNMPNIVKVLKNTSYYKNLALQSKSKECQEYGLATLDYKNSNNNKSHCPILDNMNLALDPRNPETYFIGGKRFENAEVDMDPDSKWYIDSSERERLGWPSTFYPTYLNGPCYIISGNVVRSIYETSFQVPIYPFEDVYLVGMIAYDRLNLHISNIPAMHLDVRNGFGYGMYVSLVRKRSRLEKILAMHPLERPSLMWKLCKRISSCSELTRSAGGLKVKADGILQFSAAFIVLLITLPYFRIRIN